MTLRPYTLLASLLMTLIALGGTRESALGKPPPTSAAVAQTAPGEVDGIVLDRRSHRPVVGVRVVATSSASGQSAVTTSGTDGAFTFRNLAPGEYRLLVHDTEYATSAPTSVEVRAAASATVVLDVVAAEAIIGRAIARSRPGAPLISPQDVHRSAQTQAVLGTQQVESQSPAAGAGQLLSTAPGVLYSSFGSSGAAKGMISLRGFKQGWANNAGIVEDGLIGVTLDGVYLNNPQTGIWEPDEVPDLSTLAGSVITYGPGDPLTRTFDSIGGTIDFYTLSPSATPISRLDLSTGSYGTQAYALRYSNALSDHWRFLVAQGRQFTDGYRQPYGSTATEPGAGYATLGELQDTFGRGTLTLLAYGADGTEMRPNLVPVTPLTNGPANPTQVVTVNGFDTSGNAIPGPLYSQQTTGFYSALPENVWQKTDSNATRLVAADLEYGLDARSSLDNLLWYRHGDRLHVKNFNFDQEDALQQFEYNNPYSNTVGDKISYHRLAGASNYAAGLDYFYGTYNTHNAFYNPNPIGPNPGPPTTITNPSKFRDNFFYLYDFAAFVQDQIHLSPQLTLTPGLRAVSLGTNFVNGGNAGFPNCYQNPDGTCTYNQTGLGNSATSFGRIEPSGEVRYAITPSLAFYGSYSTATRDPSTSPGGPYQNVAVSTLQPEIGEDLEGGFKFLRALGGSTVEGTPREVRLNAGLFEERFLNQYIAISQGANEQKTATGDGSSKYAGLTLDFAVDPTRELSLFGSYGLTHAVFLTYVVGGTSYNGLPVSEVPVTTGNLGVEVRLPEGRGDRLDLRAFDQYVGPQPMWNNNLGAPDPTGLQIPAYDLVNGSLTYHWNARAIPISLTLSATNFFNKQYNSFEYVTSGAYFGGGDGQSIAIGAGGILAEPGPPRELQATLTFGR